VPTSDVLVAGEFSAELIAPVDSAEIVWPPPISSALSR
jgi:hypothetical protein